LIEFDKDFEYANKGIVWIYVAMFVAGCLGYSIMVISEAEDRKCFALERLVAILDGNKNDLKEQSGECADVGDGMVVFKTALMADAGSRQGDEGEYLTGVREVPGVAIDENDFGTVNAELFDKYFTVMKATN
jgi:hypothetical protein